MSNEESTSLGHSSRGISTIWFSNCCRSPRGCSAHRTGERPPHKPELRTSDLSPIWGAARVHLVPRSPPHCCCSQPCTASPFPEAFTASMGCKRYSRIWGLSILKHHILYL